MQFGGRTSVATEVVCSLGQPILRFPLLRRIDPDNYLGQVPLSNMHIYSTKLSK